MGTREYDHIYCAWARLARSGQLATQLSFAIILAILLLPGIAWGGALPEYDRVRVLQDPRSITDSVLVNHERQDFRLSELKGQVVLVFFGFTNCPDVCPATLGRLKQLQDLMEPAGRDVAYVLISVDGERDSPEVLKNYLAKYSPKFIGLTEEPKRVKAIAKDFSAAFFKEQATGDKRHYNVSHSPQVFLLDQDGRLRAEFYNATVEAMKSTLLALIDEADDDGSM
jgi:protein SCO1/2